MAGDTLQLWGKCSIFCTLLCLTKSKPCYYQPLRNIWWSVMCDSSYLLLKALRCFHPSLHPLHWYHYWCMVLFWLCMSCIGLEQCIFVEVKLLLWNCMVSLRSVVFMLSVSFFFTFFLPCFSCTPWYCPFWVFLRLLSQMSDFAGNCGVATRKMMEHPNGLFKPRCVGLWR